MSTRQIAGARPDDDRRDRIDGQRRIGFDRILDTALPVRGTLAAPVSRPGSSERDVITIGWRPAIAAPIDDPAGGCPIWSQSGPFLCFAAPGVADYRCTATSIDVAPVLGTSYATIEALLIATALPASLWLGGDIMLHAAAIVPHDQGDGALAIAGASGSGKSRLAAAFLARGAALVADDSIAVRRKDGQVRCAGLAGGYHLGRHPGLPQDADERAFHPVAGHRTRHSARLAAIVVLADDPQVSRARLQTLEAIEMLLANRHRASVPRRCGLEPRSLRDMAYFARTIPVWRWPRHDADALLDDDIRHVIMQEKGKR